VFVKIRNIIQELGRLTPMALVMVLLPMAGTFTLIAFLDPIGEWLRSNWEIGTIVYFAVTVIVCGLALIPTNVIGLVGGWAFGFWLGLAILMAAILGASLLSFFIHSKFSGRRLPNAVSRHVKVDAIYRALMREDYWRTTFIIFLLRVSFTPFAFTNFLLASARVSIGPFVLGTFMGMLPRSAAMVLAGAGLAQLDPQSSRDIVALFMGLAATVCAIVVVARFSRSALARIAENETAPEMSPLTQG
jgi:uncharacterized membrane protein YdjX (TVP38/TMEM64 family)